MNTMNNDTNKYLLIGLVFAGLVYSLSAILMPFLSAALLAYLGDPLVDKLEQKKWSRSLAVSLVFVVIFCLLSVAMVVLLPLLEQQISILLGKVPMIVAWLKQTALPWLQMRFVGLAELDVDKLQQGLQDNIGGASSIAAGFVSSVSASGMAFVSALANVVLIPVVTFYLLRDWDVMVAKIHDAMPRRVEKKSSQIAKEVDAVLGAFFKGQVLVMLCLAVLYFIGLSIVGLEFALLIAIIAGLVSFVPYLGLIVGLLLACLASLLQLHDASGILAVLLVFTVVQVLESVVLTPILVGDKIGLHPVAVIFAVMAGGQLFGFTGILLALPIAAVLLVLFNHVNDRYKESELYKQV